MNDSIQRRFLAAGGVRVTKPARRAGDSIATVEGMAVVWDAMSHDLGGWREKIAAGAFTDALRSAAMPILGLYDHEAGGQVSKLVAAAGSENIDGHADRESDFVACRTRSPHSAGHHDLSVGQVCARPHRLIASFAAIRASTRRFTNAFISRSGGTESTRASRYAGASR